VTDDRYFASLAGTARYGVTQNVSAECPAPPTGGEEIEVTQDISGRFLAQFARMATCQPETTVGAPWS
jgi:hypothetical protein